MERTVRPLDLKDIVMRYLVNNGYDGLTNKDVHCSCSMDVLMWCGNPSPVCLPAYREPCEYVDGVCIWCDSPESEKDINDGMHFTTEKPRSRKNGTKKDTGS
jgi:hypothetical protein